jgi:hypothetical protein
MKISFISTGMLLAAVALLLAASPAPAQQPGGDELRRVEPARPLHSAKGTTDVDLAAARADAHAKASGQQKTDVDVTNKLNQKQAAIGIGTGGSSSVELKNKNTNVNTLKTGDVVNLNVNDNKQIQTFGVPFVRTLTPR